jgi:hypothetical protein
VRAEGVVVAEHTRALGRGSESLLLDHYLEVLIRKPGALAGATALVTARAGGAFTPVHQQFWDAARARHGDGPGTRALIGVLLLHRTLSASQVEIGMRAALRLNRLDPDLVAVEARRSEHTDRATPAPLALPDGVVAAATLLRPAPSLAGYDDLLSASTTAPPADPHDEADQEMPA